MYPYGSVSKSFTAVLVLKLAELKKLNIDDKLSQFQLEIPGDDSITIRDLLTHTSGLPEYFYSVDPAVTPKAGQILSMIRNAAKSSPLARGSYHYSNANYYLLSEICARAGGASFGDLLAQYVLKPIGISPQITRLPKFDLNWYGGAGDIAGTIGDLAKFGEAIAIHDKRLLTEPSWKALGTPQVDMGQSGGSKYGFGLIVAPMAIYQSLSHAGEIPPNAGEKPYVSMLIVRPDTREPVSFAAFRRTAWDSKSLNALYGAFASICATIDLKHWISTLCSDPSTTQISGYVRSGTVSPELGEQMTPQALAGLKQRIGSLKTFVVQGEMVRPDSVQLIGRATGTSGEANVTAQFGPGGRLDGFGIK